MTRYAKSVGADAALVVVPYYNKPTQEGKQELRGLREEIERRERGRLRVEESRVKDS